MAKLTTIRSDAKKEIDGVWFDYEEGIRACVARLGNPTYEKFVREETKRQSRNRKLTDEEHIQIQKLAVATTILKGWENVEDDDGNAIEFSVDAAVTVFNDKELHDFYRFVIMCSTDQMRFRKEALEESAKN